MNERETRRWRICPVTLCAGLIALLGTPTHGLENSPTVLVELRIDPDSQFTRELSASEKEQLSSTITARVKALCEERFSFVRWLTVAEEGEPAAKLVLSLFDENTTPTKNLAKFVGEIADTEYQLLVPPMVIFHWTHTRTAPVLISKLVKELDKLFSLDGIKDHFHEEFLNSIPLSTDVLADDQLKRIIVPIEWAELRAKPETYLDAKFKRKGLHGVEQEGVLTLFSLRRHAGEGQLGAIEAMLLFMDSPPITVLEPKNWPERLGDHLATRTEVEVTMRKYVRDPDPGVEDDLVTEPPPR